MPHKKLLTELLFLKSWGYLFSERTHTSSTKLIKYPTERQGNAREK